MDYGILMYIMVKTLRNYWAVRRVWLLGLAFFAVTGGVTWWLETLPNVVARQALGQSTRYANLSLDEARLIRTESNYIVLSRFIYIVKLYEIIIDTSLLQCDVCFT